jgi:hypothetical protein
MQPRLAILILGVLVVGGIGYRVLTTGPTVPRGDVVPTPVPRTHLADEPSPEIGETPASPETPEEMRRRLLPGVWQDEYQGKRTMTLSADGTGTMIVELTGVQAKLFASRLQFDMQWSLAGDTLRKTTIGGEPAKKVNLILKMMGDTATEKIVEITDARLRLLDQNGKTEYDWKRIPPTAPAPAGE